MKLDRKCIYIAKNLIDGNVYIGQTNNLNRRIIEHRAHAKKDGGAFHEAIREIGLECFSFDILEWCSPTDVDMRERYYISYYRKRLGVDKVYNYCDGGKGGQTHDVNGENNPQFGKHKTESEREALSRMLTGRKKPAGFGEKISKALKGKPKSPEYVLKRGHPISVVNASTGEVIHFSSKSELERTLHCSAGTVMRGRITHNGYKLYEN